MESIQKIYLESFPKLEKDFKTLNSV